MRLRDYQNLLQEVLVSLRQLNKTTIQNNTRGLGIVNDAKVLGLIEYNRAIDKLLNANVFIDVIAKIRTYEVFHRIENEVIVAESSWNSLKDLNNKLIMRIEDLLNTINNILPIENEESINLKIPQDITNVSELKDFIANIDLIFHVYKDFNYKVNFTGVETGSAWISILIGVGVAAKPCIEFLFKIAEKSLELRNLKLEGDRKTLEIEELKGKISAQEYEKVIKARKEKNDEEYDKLKIKLAKETLKILKAQNEKYSNENEILEKTKISLEKIGELIDKGMEIVPAFNAPEEIKVLSTDYCQKLEEHKNKMIGLNNQKLLEQKDDKKVQKQKNNKDDINE